MTQKFICSIILACYRQKKTVELLLATLERQTEKNFEVLLADDGSNDGTDAVVQQAWGFPIQFFTQADQGYRKSQILNEAVRHAQSDYLIFIDGDVLLEKHFVADHCALRKKDHFVCGRRVDLGPLYSAGISLETVQQGRFDRFDLNRLWSAIRQDTLGWKRSIRLPWEWVRECLGYHRPIDLLGSNFSLWKADFLEVNGFEESFQEYWGEDGDLYIRLRNAGKKAINAKGLCIQYHVFHVRREPSEGNIQKYQELLENHEYRRAKKGYFSE